MFKEINAVVAKELGGALEVFIQNIATEHSLEPENLIQIWNQDPERFSLISLDQISCSTKDSHPKASNPQRNKKRIEPAKLTTECTVCTYRLTKGTREGEECGGKPRRGGIYCSRHKAHENTQPKLRKSIPSIAKSSPTRSKPRKKDEKKDDIEESESSSAVAEFAKHADIDGCYYHRTTGMVRKKDSSLIERKLLDNKVVNLENDDIKICSDNGLTICPDILKDLAPVDHIEELKTLKQAVAILNVNGEAIAVEDVLRELQLDP